MGIIKRLFFNYEWICAYRFINDKNENVIPTKEEKREYTVLKVPKGFWAADPFILNYEDQYYLFFEYTNKKKDKAIIAATSLSDGEIDIKEIYEFKGHTSYPCIFKYEENYYMIPETCSDKKLTLLKCDKLPDVWSDIATLLIDWVVADCTPFFKDGRLYLFIYRLEKEYSANGDLYIAELDMKNYCLKNINLVKKNRPRTGRPGGNCFKQDNEYIRVTQPCIRFYGEKIEFYRFAYENSHYKETHCGDMTIENVLLNENYDIEGIHTINRCDRLEVIDLRLKYQFDLFRPLKKLCQKLGVFGYDSCDKKYEYLYGDRPLQERKNS